MWAGAFSVAPAPAAVPAAGAGRRAWAERATTALLVLAVLLALIVGVGAALGFRTAVVLTGSMRPALAPNDMLVTKRITPDQARSGDIISFAAPGEPGKVITHRVRSVRIAPDGRLAFVTQGDANNTAERWSIPADGKMARVVSVLPQVGTVTEWSSDPTTRTLVFAVLGAGFLLFGLRRIWGTP
jgi:signal peptidase